MQNNSLYERALIASTVALFTKDPVRNEILSLLKNNSWYDLWNDLINHKYMWEKINQVAFLETEKLNLPQKLKQDIQNTINPIGLEIFAWALHYRQICCYKPSLLNSLCWTSQGAIDGEKTSKKLMRKKLGPFYSYRLACINCFKQNIPKLWKKLNTHAKDLKRIKKEENSLVVFWSYYLNGKANELISDESSVYEYGLDIAVKQGNYAATKYFWNKLTPKEKEKNLKKCFIEAAAQPLKPSNRSKISNELPEFPESSGIRNLCFFLEQLNVKQQKEVFANSSTVAYHVLKCLIRFPYRHLFLQVAEHTLDFVEKGKYDFLLDYIPERIKDDPKVYSEFLCYLWEKVPNKDSAIKEWKYEDVIQELFYSKDYKSINLILNSVSKSAREEFFIHRGMHICYNLIRCSEWNVLHDLMQYCLLNKEAALKFQKEELVSEKLKDESRKIQFHDLLLDFIASFDHEKENKQVISRKRKIEDVADVNNKKRKILTDQNDESQQNFCTNKKRKHEENSDGQPESKLNDSETKKLRSYVEYNKC